MPCPCQSSTPLSQGWHKQPPWCVNSIPVCCLGVRGKVRYLRQTCNCTLNFCHDSQFLPAPPIISPKPQTPDVLTPQRKPVLVQRGLGLAWSNAADTRVGSNLSPGRNVSVAPGCNYICTQRGLFFFFFLFANIKSPALLRDRILSTKCYVQAASTACSWTAACRYTALP